jgi:hypothetical protein
MAIVAYSEAIALAPQNHVLWANRAASHGCLGNWPAAAEDAGSCVERQVGVCPLGVDVEVILPPSRTVCLIWRITKEIYRVVFK